MQKEEKRNKHMTLDDRIEIQECLVRGMTFKAIARRIGKNQTTVSREVKLHSQVYRNGYVKTDEICPRLLKAPFVCNGCEKKSKNSCPYIRRVYMSKQAQEAYETVRTDSRSGVALNKESFYETEKVISDAVRKGQHIYHVIKANKLSVSTATVYRYINRQYCSIGRIDLPRAVKFKPRNTAKTEHIPSSVKKGRTYEDFLDYIERNDGISIVQLDTVIGRIDGKTIMTIHFVASNFMIGLLLENKTAAEAAHKIEALKSGLKSDGYEFGDIAPVLLTDNGGEFSIISAFENDTVGYPESHLFFCEPSSPEEKPEIEKNHTLFRDIVPKGISFDDFTQETVNRIFSHVNAVKRKQFNGKSSYDMFTFYFSKELASALGISFVPATDVLQSPLLLKNS